MRNPQLSEFFVGGDAIHDHDGHPINIKGFSKSSSRCIVWSWEDRECVKQSYAAPVLQA